MDSNYTERSRRTSTRAEEEDFTIEERPARGRKTKRPVIFSRSWLLLLLWLYICYIEIILRASTAEVFWGSGLFLSCLFALVPALLLYVPCRLFPTRVNRWLQRIVFFLLFLIFAAQLIYFKVFACFFSAYSMGNGGQVLEFWKVVVNTILKSWLPLILMLLPPVALLVFEKRFSTGRIRRWKRLLIPFAAAFVLHFFIVLILPIFGKQPMSAYDLYHNTSNLTSAVEEMGLLPAFRLDVHRLIFGFDEGSLTLEPDPTEPPATEDPSSSADPSQTVEPTEPVDPNAGLNVMEIDFDALMAGETDDTVLQLHQYFSTRTPTSKNEKTGMFEGCNLILLTCEGFSHLAIDPELTPTLYKMQQEGFNFTNFYTPIWGVSTSDGEYVAVTGTIPKGGTWSFRDSSENAMPLTMVQQLKRLGYTAYGYHNHTASFYDRDLSHPNLGYIFKARDTGLDVKHTWPESDLEMIDLTTEEYIHQQPFHAYYMTVSGHLEYNFRGNYIAYKNVDYVRELPISIAPSAYLACHVELDKAMELLLQRLEEAGVAENTVIVMSADHYPYGLTVDEQSELAGHAIDERFEMYRNACIIYKKGMTPETVDRPCSSLDILPTLSNLFGLEFDSRLYIGQDVFSEAEPLIIFNNRSWLTDKGSYYAPNGDVTSFTGEEITEEYIDRINDIVRNKFTVSAWVLDTDYWRTIYGDNLPPDE